MTLSNFRFQTRGDTAANWTSVDPVLAEREIGLETDTNKFKVGDGVSVWSALSYWNTGGGGSGDMVLADVQTVTGKKTFGSAGAVGKLAVAGTTSGSTIIDAAAVAGSGTVTLPTTGTLATLAGTETLSNKTLVAPALGTPASGTLTNCTGLPVSTGVSGLAANVATFLATPSSANLAAALTDETGTGANVFANSPTLVTPALGTPSSVTLTNATGLPVSTGITGLGTGVATFLATPSSANLAAALTDETGTGANVFANSPTLVTPALGTPSSVVLTNATGLPLTTGVTGILPHGNLGTGGGGSTKFLREDSTYQTISGGGDALVANPLSQFAATTSAQLAGVISDETGTGALVFANTPTLVTPVLGVASATSVNKVAITTPATGSTLTIADGATLTVSASATVSNGTHSGTNTGDQNLFSTIAVSGQSDVVADTASDTLTLVAGSNVTITTNAGTDTITIAASGGGGNSFETIAVSGQSNVVADSSTDTLTLVAGTNVTITTDASTDSITINSSQTNITGNAGTVTVADAGGDTTTWIMLATSQTGSLAPATDAGLTYNSTTNAITAGQWNATTIDVFYGGTGAGTFTDGGVLIGNGTGAVQSTSAGTAGQVLTSNGAGVDPTFQNASGGSGANPTASVGLTAVNGVASTFLRSDGAPALDVAIAPTWTGNHVYSKNGALSLPTIQTTGTWITGGTSTTTKPYVLIEPTGATSTAWSTNGTGLGVNAATGFTGNLIDVQLNGVSRFSVNSAGNTIVGGTFSTNGYTLAAATTLIGFNGRSGLRSSANGLLTLLNNAETSFTRLNFGGTTSSFPAIGMSGTQLSVQLADGTAGGGLTVSTPLAKVGGAIEEFISSVGTPASTTETDLYSFTTVANTLLSNGDKLLFRVIGFLGANSTNSVEIKFYFGGTQISTSGSFTQGAAAGTFQADLTIIRVDSTTVRAGCAWVFGGGTPTPKVTYASYAGFTLSSTNILKITGKSTGASPVANDVAVDMGFINWFPVG